MVNTLVRELLPVLMEINTKENGKMENLMVRELEPGLMEVNM